jgi:uncharacterized membrane protein YbhN (UPF0104 family)
MPPPSHPKPKYWQSAAFRIAGSVVILALLLTRLPFHKVWSTMQHVSPWLGVGLLCCYLALHLVGVVKWRTLINLAGADLPFLQAVRCYYAGLFGNIFLPSLVGGDFVKAGIAFRHSRSKAAVVLGSLIDRVQDTLGLLAVAAVGALLLPRALDPKSQRAFWTVAGILTLGGVSAVGAMFLIPVRKFPFKIRRILARLRSGVRALYRRRVQVFLCFCSGMFIQSCLIAINFRLGEESGLHVPFYVWMFAWPLSKL